MQQTILSVGVPFPFRHRPPPDIAQPSALGALNPQTFAS